MLETLVGMSVVMLEHVGGHSVVLVAAVQLMRRWWQEWRQRRRCGSGAIVQMLGMQLLLRDRKLGLLVLLVLMRMLVEMWLVLIGAIERRCSSGTAGKQGNGKDERLDTGLRIYGRHMLHHAGPCGHIEHIGSPDRRLFAHFLLARQDPW